MDAILTHSRDFQSLANTLDTLSGLSEGAEGERVDGDDLSLTDLREDIGRLLGSYPAYITDFILYSVRHDIFDWSFTSHTVPLINCSLSDSLPPSHRRLDFLSQPFFLGLTHSFILTSLQLSCLCYLIDRGGPSRLQTLVAIQSPDGLRYGLGSSCSCI